MSTARDCWVHWHWQLNFWTSKPEPIISVALKIVMSCQSAYCVVWFSIPNPLKVRWRPCLHFVWFLWSPTDVYASRRFSTLLMAPGSQIGIFFCTARLADVITIGVRFRSLIRWVRLAYDLELLGGSCYHAIQCFLVVWLQNAVGTLLLTVKQWFS